MELAIGILIGAYLAYVIIPRMKTPIPRPGAFLGWKEGKYYVSLSFTSDAIKKVNELRSRHKPTVTMRVLMRYALALYEVAHEDWRNDQEIIVRPKGIPREEGEHRIVPPWEE